MHCHVPPQILLRNDLLVQIRRRALAELVVSLLPHALVGLDVVPHHLRGFALLNNTYVDVAAGAEIVEDTCHDGFAADLDGAVPVEVS